ncbi:MAG TPA: hypothetical protein VF690_17645 [Hymenobacter sp.]
MHYSVRDANSKGVKSIIDVLAKSGKPRKKLAAFICRAMKIRIETALQQLVGLQVSGSTRASDMECLKFGHQQIIDQRGMLCNVGLFALHLQCAWRITNGTELLIGSSDLYIPASETDDINENFDWEISGANLRDYKLQELLGLKLLVDSVKADAYGGFSLFLDQKIVLEGFPACSMKDDYSEYWRLLDNRFGPGQSQHFVVRPTGAEDE